MRTGNPTTAWLIACALLSFSWPQSGTAGAPEARILGNWLTEDGDGIIQIIRQDDGHFDGRIVGGYDIDRPDVHNPDPRKRHQVLRGEIILEGLRYEGHDRWSGGTVYDPDSGHTYRCHIDLIAPDRLRLRGFLGISILGRSQTWTRYKGTIMERPGTG